MKVQARLCISLLVLSYLIVAGPCYAHKVRIFAWNEGDTIHTESKFSGGKAAQNATVTVVATDSGKELLQGTTNQNGLFQFATPITDSAEIDIIVNSGDGHKNHWLYQLSPIVSRSTETSSKKPVVVKATEPTSQPVQLTGPEFTELMDALLEEKLAPIRQQLALQQEKEPTIQDILGGIGYLLGLAGIAAYIKSKK